LGILSAPTQITAVLVHTIGKYFEAQVITGSISQAVIGRGFDENLEQGARCKSSKTTLEIRACLRKILQQNFPKRRSSRCWNIDLPVLHIQKKFFLIIVRRIFILKISPLNKKAARKQLFSL
jgi:hypothetical protein